MNLPLLLVFPAALMNSAFVKIGRCVAKHLRLLRQLTYDPPGGAAEFYLSMIGGVAVGATLGAWFVDYGGGGGFWLLFNRRALLDVFVSAVFGCLVAMLCAAVVGLAEMIAGDWERRVPSF
jgi:hypothetical protein